MISFPLLSAFAHRFQEFPARDYQENPAEPPQRLPGLKDHFIPKTISFDVNYT
jgi:hypothetical protein